MFVYAVKMVDMGTVDETNILVLYSTSYYSKWSAVEVEAILQGVLIWRRKEIRQFFVKGGSHKVVNPFGDVIMLGRDTGWQQKG
jgi:hypothetical protein